MISEEGKEREPSNNLYLLPSVPSPIQRKLQFKKKKRKWPSSVGAHLPFFASSLLTYPCFEGALERTSWEQAWLRRQEHLTWRLLLAGDPMMAP